MDKLNPHCRQPVHDAAPAAHLKLRRISVHGHKHHLPWLAILLEFAVSVGQLGGEGAARWTPASGPQSHAVHGELMPLQLRTYRRAYWLAPIPPESQCNTSAQHITVIHHWGSICAGDESAAGYKVVAQLRIDAMKLVAELYATTATSPGHNCQGRECLPVSGEVQGHMLAFQRLVSVNKDISTFAALVLQPVCKQPLPTEVWGQLHRSCARPWFVCHVHSGFALV